MVVRFFILNFAIPNDVQNLPANLVDKKHNKIVAYICKRFYLDN